MIANLVFSAIGGAVIATLLFVIGAWWINRKR